MTVLLFLTFSCGVEGDVCGPEGPSEQWCPIDACAASCESVEAGTSCCLDAHGYGLSETSLERLLDDCVGDACDPEDYVSDAAALCIAQVNGLGSGVGWCGAGLVYNDADDVHWYVRNTTEGGCASGDPHTVGDTLTVNARTGEASAISTVFGSAESCE